MQIKTTFLPLIIEKRKIVIHNKNPYKALQYPIEHKEILDGIEVLKQSNCEFP